MAIDPFTSNNLVAWRALVMFIKLKQLSRMTVIQLKVALGVGLLGWATTVAAAEPEKAAPPKGREVAPGIFEIGTIGNPRLTESSGIVASRRHPGVFWTHTDGGGPKKQVLFAISREGKSLADFRVVGAVIEDWEDIATDDAGHVYVGDIGNNDARRDRLAVYEVDEPDPKSSRSLASINRGWQLRFPKKPFDCEALFVWNGQGYVISKVFNDKKADLYRFPLTDAKTPLVLERIARLPIESPVTGADISADGKRLGIVAKSGAFIFDLDGQPADAAHAPHRRAKFRHEHIEACCFVPEGLLATAETREIFLFTEAAFGSSHAPTKP
jgi:hypothetical protein